MKNTNLKKIALSCVEKLSKNNGKFLYSEEPFKHFVIDNFLPKDIADKCLSSFPSSEDKNWEITNDEDIEIKKRSNWKSEFDIPENIIDVVRILNSSLSLEKLSSILNIPKLMPDPYFTGGGLNESSKGGLLDVHIDGNYHDASGLNRRVNAILFLNPDWKEEWGGHFGLYDKDGKDCIKKILPSFNRLLVFDTSDISFHGLPEPIACPENIKRRSIILYYYTKSNRPKNQKKFKKPHSALWKKKDLKDKKGKTERKYY